ncbi:hypothetical protein Dsin_003301 [Dipteronia sinensis]|uniref:EF-hand domain-containing protein n=1 Tax=Dipteronia sinensis TaxID=43782 RepID=A0AAE0B8R8_9ROSI|nr:hypothetical protein Dsin_003301 [Dipteronia sinensis]
MRSRNTTKEPKVNNKLFEVFKRRDADGDSRLSKAKIKKAFGELGAYIPAYRTSCGLKSKPCRWQRRWICRHGRIGRSRAIC